MDEHQVFEYGVEFIKVKQKTHDLLSGFIYDWVIARHEEEQAAAEEEPPESPQDLEINQDSDGLSIHLLSLSTSITHG